MRTVEVRILPPQPISCDSARGSLVSDSWQARFGPAPPAAVHRLHVGVTHFLQIIGDESGAETTSAIKNQFCTRVGNLLLDIALDHSLAHVYRAWKMPFGPFVIFPDVHKDHFLSGVHAPFDVGNICF